MQSGTVVGRIFILEFWGEQGWGRHLWSSSSGPGGRPRDKSHIKDAFVGLTQWGPMLDGEGGPGRVSPPDLQTWSGLEHSETQSQGLWTEE